MAHDSAATPRMAASETHSTSTNGASSSKAIPRESSVKMNGTTNAGATYFHESIVVRNGLPPVMAAAAKGDRAVGGLTSDSTA
jgi:hypothetical protein